MKTSCRTLLGIAFLGVNLMPQLSVAQSQVPDCSIDPTCVSLFDRAKQQSTSGNLDEARRLYKQAYELRADPRLLFSVARVLQKQSKWDDSISYYQLFIDSPLKADEQKQKAKEYIEQCRTQLATTPTPSASAAMPQSQQNGPGTSAVAPSIPQSATTTDAHGLARPVYTKWWFWVAIGGAAVVAAGITTGVFLGTRSNEPVISDRMTPANTLVISF